MRVVIIYGTCGSKNFSWIPWLNNKLSEQGIECVVPDLPTPEGQDYTTWASIVDSINICQDDIVIGWSTGAIFALRYLKEHNIYLDNLITISGFNNYIGPLDWVNNINKDFFVDDVSKLKDVARSITCIKSDDDPKISQQALIEFAKKISGHIVNIHNGGHFSESSGWYTFEQLLDLIVSIKESICS